MNGYDQPPRDGKVDLAGMLTRTITRPIVTIAVTGTFCYLAVQGVISSEVFVAAALPIIGFWFGDRGADREA